MVDPLKQDPLNLEEVLTDDRSAVTFLQKIDRWSEIDGDWLWSGWYTSSKHSNAITAKPSPHNNFISAHPEILEGDIPLVKLLTEHTEVSQLVQATGGSIKTGGGDKRVFAISARMILLMLLTSQTKSGIYVRKWFRMETVPKFETVLNIYFEAQKKKQTEQVLGPGDNSRRNRVVEMSAKRKDVISNDSTASTVNKATQRFIPPAKDIFPTIYCDAGVVRDKHCTVLAAYDPATGIGVIEYIPRLISTFQAEVAAIVLGYQNFPHAEIIKTDNADAIALWEVVRDLPKTSTLDEEHDGICFAALRGKNIQVVYFHDSENPIPDALAKYGRSPEKAGKYRIGVTENGIEIEPIEVEPEAIEVTAVVATETPSLAMQLVQKRNDLLADIDRLKAVKTEAELEFARMQAEFEQRMAQLDVDVESRIQEANALIPAIEVLQRQEQPEQRKLAASA